MFVYLSIYLSIFLSICKLENEAILRDFLNLWTWQHQKRSNLRDSSIFELDNVKNEASLRGFLNFRSWQHQKWNNSARLASKMESWVQSWWPRTNAYCDSFIPSVQSSMLATKKWGQVIQVLHLSRKIISANLKIWCSKMQPVYVSLVLRPPCDMHLCRYSSNVPRLPMLLKLLQNPHVLLTFGYRLPCACHKTTLQRPKVARTCGVFSMFTSNVVRVTTAYTFSTFDLRKVLRGWGVFCIFWLRNVLRTTTACTFSSLTWPDGTAPAALASLLFDPPEPHNIGIT